MMTSSANPGNWCNELASYLAANFQPEDRLAVVLINKQAGSVVQRLTSAEQIATVSFQGWLRQENAMHYDVYLSMNALHPNAVGRRKQDVATVRHIFLDFDGEADAAVRGLSECRALPPAHYIVHTSPNKCQVIWRVDGFEKEEAEQLQRGLARQTGADRAATDCARVLRIPYFYNHKYGAPYWIRVEIHSARGVHKPKDFPRFAEERAAFLASTPGKPRLPGRSSQSERDWAFAKRALERGEKPELVIAAIASYRRYDKHDPQYYAKLTVQKAAEALRTARAQASLQTPEWRDGR